MVSQQIVDKSESVTLKAIERKTPIWVLEIILDLVKYLPITIGIRFVYWGKISTDN